MKYVFSCCLLICWLLTPASLHSQADNLVLNPDFESTSVPLPLDRYSSRLDREYNFNHKLKSWSSPFAIMPDIVRLEDHPPGAEHTNASNSLVGLTIYDPAADDPYGRTYDYLSFLQGSLKEPLTKDELYYFEIWVKRKVRFENNKEFIPYGNKAKNDISHVDRLIACNNLGLRLLDHQLDFEFNPKRRTSFQQMTPDFNHQKMISPDGQWERISGYFRSPNQAKFFLIGNFFPTDQTEVSLPEEARKVHSYQGKQIPEERSAHYYLDRVLIRKLFDAEKKALFPERKIEFTVQDVLFRSNESSLIPEKLIELHQFIDSLLLLDQSFRIHIHGHTDNIGNHEDNLTLSQQRAESVQQLLLSKGIPSDWLTTHAHGESQPIASNQSPAGRAVNRRVNLVVDLDYFQASRDPSKTLKTLDIYAPSNDIMTPEALNFIGEHQKAMLQDVAFSEDFDATFFQPLLERAQSHRKAAFADPIDFIVNKAVTEQLIIINEAHLYAQHRYFLAQLLDELFAIGYRNIFCEALNKSKFDQLKDLPYPSVELGYYLRDPVYGDVFRKGKKIGYHFFAYEPDLRDVQKAKRYLYQQFGHTIDTDTSEYYMLDPQGRKHSIDEMQIEMSARDLAQAFNIEKQLKTIEGKTIVFCGGGHLKEKAVGLWKPMAIWLKQFSAIDPFTIQQVTYSKPGLAQILTHSSVLLDDQKQALILREANPFAKDSLQQMVDLQVIHPYPTFSNGRSSWQVNDRDRNQQKPKLSPNISYPCIVMAFPKNEPLHAAIPVDVIELQSDKDPKPLLLPPGDYNLLIKDAKGKISKKQLSNDSHN
ncbi:MAG: OmpA family protein [Bacteroidota bacterium]